jgi:hypothetical protein
VLYQPSTELAQYRKIEARIGEREAEGILQVNARPHGFSSLPIWQPFDILNQRHQGQPPGRQGRLASGGKEVDKERIGKERPQRIP